MATDVDTEELELLYSAAPDEGPREMYMVLYPKEMEEEIVRTLDEVGVPGYTEFPKLIGRGRKVRHFDNSIWPGATGAIVTVVCSDQGGVLARSFRDLNANLEQRSRGLYGLHLFSWPCRQII